MYPLLLPIRVDGLSTGVPNAMTLAGPVGLSSLLRDMILDKEDLKLLARLSFLILQFDFLNFIFVAP